jgi:hypothetical protein
MAHVVSRWLLTAEAHVSPRGICGGQNGTEKVFSEFFHFPLSSFDMAPYLYIV